MSFQNLAQRIACSRRLDSEAISVSRRSAGTIALLLLSERYLLQPSP